MKIDEVIMLRTIEIEKSENANSYEFISRINCFLC